MSVNALRTATTGTAAVPAEKPKTIAGLLTDPAVKAQLAMALPKHMTADRLARIALTEVRKVPKLAKCDQTSFLGAIMQCAQIGLEPGGALGHAYLLPFDRREKVNGTWKTVGTDVQLIIGYRGMIDLARRSGQIVSIEARTVHAKDEFEVEFGLESRIVHKPAWEAADRGPVTFVYAVAKLKDGGVQFDVMSRAEIETIRNNSQGYKAAMDAAKRYDKEPTGTPWLTHFDEMAKKTVIRRLFKYLPVSIEIQRAVGLDEMADRGVSQDNALVIDGEFSHVSTREDDEAAAAVAAGDGAESSQQMTPAEVIAAINDAKDIDSLDVAADMIRMLPEDQRKDANEAHRTRRVALTSE